MWVQLKCSTYKPFSDLLVCVYTECMKKSDGVLGPICLSLLVQNKVWKALLHTKLNAHNSLFLTFSQPVSEARGSAGPHHSSLQMWTLEKYDCHAYREHTELYYSVYEKKFGADEESGLRPTEHVWCCYVNFLVYLENLYHFFIKAFWTAGDKRQLWDWRKTNIPISERQNKEDLRNCRLVSLTSILGQDIAVDF